MSRIDDDEDEGTGTDGGSGDIIHFRYKDILAAEPRDDLLPASKIKHILAMHDELHKTRVDKQKQIRKERELLKSGRTITPEMKYQIQMGRSTGGGGSASNYKTHPITQKPQFSGMDQQVSALPTENKAETNQELKEALENRHQLRYQNAPTFNPKPRPY
jgi:hypothetical protein